MSERLYYEDAYITRFEAKIIERVTDNGEIAVVLNKTYFYPTSGGQPHDKGWINRVPVTNVTIRDEDGAVLHWLDGREVPESEVTAEIDWPRRLDHMQHHTGQHILSQAFLRVANAETVSFHLSDSSVTIDLDANSLPPTQVQQAERLANEVVWQNRPIRVRTVTLSEVEDLPLRKVPPARNGGLRLVDIEDFDLTACGGTHVAATGCVGIVKVLRQERRGGQVRIEFCCGQRALDDYQEKNDVVNQLKTELTTGTHDLVVAVNRLQAEAREAQSMARKQQAVLLRFEADDLWQKGTQYGEVTVVTRVFTDKNPAQLGVLAKHLIENKVTVALLGLAGSKTHLLFGRSTSAPGDMNQLLAEALEALGSGSGGGSPSFAQGGGPTVAREQLQKVLTQVETVLIDQIH